MILVTGATGNIGKELIQDLKDRGKEFKVMVRKEETRALMETRGIQAVLGDFNRPETFAAALKGVRQAFLLTTPRMDIVNIEGAFLDVARKAGVQRVVRLSAVGANPWGSSPLARAHGRCEAQLESCGLAWTILRPTMFMQNLTPMYGESVAMTSTLYAPAGDARIPFVDTRDVAAVATAVLTGAGHEGLVYEITGPELYTYAGVAQLLSAQLGRTVEFVDVPDDAAYKSMTDLGMSEYMAHSLITLFHLFRANGSTAVTLGTVTRLTGRPARTLQTYLKENLNVFRGSQRSQAHPTARSEDREKAGQPVDMRHYSRVSVEPQCKARFQLGGQVYNNIAVSNLGEDGCCLTGSSQALGGLDDKAMLEGWEFIHPGLPKGSINAKVIWVKRPERDPAGTVTTGVQFMDAPTGYARKVGKYVTTLVNH
jgi:uncharacterized protein YbjT (DUF2867 family)